MRSFTTVCALSFAGGVYGRVLQAPTPTITTGPSAAGIEAVKRQGPDAVSLAKVLLTAIPESLRQIAATNLPAVSSILWEEFLDDNKPWWFLELPPDIQSYLISQFGPPTAIPTPSIPSWSSAEVTEPSLTVTSNAGETSAAESSTPSESQITSVGSNTMVTSASAVSSNSDSNSKEGSAATSLTGTRPSNSPASESTSPPAPESDEEHSGMSKQQKIGVGVGVPLSLLGALAIGVGCCFLRRRRHKSVNGSVPPSSPGFIPRFAFQEKSSENLEHRPLRDSDSSSQDLAHTTWDDDVIEPTSTIPNTSAYNNTPVMAPALFHTHSSNRARGMRTSYTSLRSVPEVSESDEAESPTLPRQSPPQGSTLHSSPSRHSLPRKPVLPPLAAVPQIKRKPVPSSPDSTTHKSAADLASQSLLRQTMPDVYESSPPRFGNYSQVTSGSPSTQVSPLESRSLNNPFSNNYSYVEDYGPEYNDAHLDIEDGLYGGHTSLSRYPEPKKNSKTEWPLRNTIGRGHRRNRSPMWDRVYEG